MSPKYTLKDIRKVTTHDFFWSHFVVAPFADRCLWVVANYTKITPNQLTILGFILTIASAFSFLQGTILYLIIGAFLFEIAFLFDCIDGGLARLKGIQSDFGDYLDHIFSESFGKFIAGFCLVYGQYLISGEIIWLILGILFVFIYYLTVSFFTYLQRMKFKYKLDSLMELERVDNFYTKSLIKKYFNWCKKRRVNIIPFTLIEFETVIFFIGPLTGFIKECLIFAISIQFIVYCLSSFFFLRGFRKISESNE